MPTCTQCSVVIIGISCLVFEIRDEQRKTDGLTLRWWCPSQFTISHPFYRSLPIPYILHRIFSSSDCVWLNICCLFINNRWKVCILLWGRETLNSVMFRLTRRRVLFSYFMLIIVWAIITVLMHIVVGGWSPLWFFFGRTRKLDHDQLKLLMASSLLDEHNATLFADPLLQLLAPGNNFFHFFSLPKRKSHVLYGEVLSSIHH